MLGKKSLYLVFRGYCYSAFIQNCDETKSLSKQRNSNCKATTFYEQKLFKNLNYFLIFLSKFNLVYPRISLLCNSHYTTLIPLTHNFFAIISAEYYLTNNLK